MLDSPSKPAGPHGALRQAHAEAVRSVDLAIGELRRGEPVVVVSAERHPILVLAAETASDQALQRCYRLAEAHTPASADLPSSAALAPPEAPPRREADFQPSQPKRLLRRSRLAKAGAKPRLRAGRPDGGPPAAPRLALAARRAAALSLCDVAPPAVVSVAGDDRLTAEAVRTLADPTAPAGAVPPCRAVAVMAAGSAAAVAVELSRLACLLPAAVLIPLAGVEADRAQGWAATRRLLTVARDDIVTYAERVATSLRKAGEARVPLAGAEDTRIVAFRPADGGVEHLAIVIGRPNRHQPVLTRVHSQCFTGDLLASLRCDCGDQLRGAIQAISAAGGGVLLYLAQEGRGIGLVNKLRAYNLQDGGLDTVDANQQLGFEGDERLYLAAAAMLRELGIRRVHLMTNNPAKVEALEQCGIVVADRVAHVVPANPHNAEYLATKARRSGHAI